MDAAPRRPIADRASRASELLRRAIVPLDHDLVRDLAQDVRLRVHEKLHLFEDRGATFERWLRVVVRSVLDHRLPRYLSSNVPLEEVKEDTLRVRQGVTAIAVEVFGPVGGSIHLGDRGDHREESHPWTPISLHSSTRRWTFRIHFILSSSSNASPFLLFSTMSPRRGSDNANGQSMTFQHKRGPLDPST